MDTPKIGTPEWIALLEAKIKTLKNARPLSQEEMAQLIYECKARNLDPLLRQIYVVFRNNKNNPGHPDVNFQTSIDALRLVASRTREYAGSDEATFVEKEGRIIKSAITVYRMVAGQRCPTSRSAYFDEYRPKYPEEMWQTKPHVMIAKCAEALALRAAFPEELGGLYTEEEMAQAQPDPRLENPMFVALTEALRETKIGNFELAAYLKEQHGSGEFSKLPEDTQRMTLEHLKSGAVREWTKGLLNNLSNIARAKNVTPAQLADECKARYGEAAAGKLSHAQRAELFRLIEQGEIKPLPQPTPTPETKATDPQENEKRTLRGTILSIEKVGALVACKLRIDANTDRTTYFRAEHLPEGMPEENKWNEMNGVLVVGQCELVPKKSGPQTKLLILRSIEVAKVEQETVVARIVSVGEKTEADAGIPIVIEGHADTPEHVLLYGVAPSTAKLWPGKTFRMLLRKTAAPHRIASRPEEQKEEDDIPSRAEDFKDNPKPGAPEEKRGASPEFRAEMEKRQAERKLKTIDPLSVEALVALAAKQGISTEDLNRYVAGVYGDELSAEIPPETREMIRENIGDGSVNAYLKEMNELFNQEQPAAAAV